MNVEEGVLGVWVRRAQGRQPLVEGGNSRDRHQELI
jgi:hypothetical protein